MTVNTDAQTTQTPKFRTITLSNAAPVSIREDEWPLIYQSTVRFFAQYWFEFCMRRHADGRAIVYGSYADSAQALEERDAQLRGGYALARGADPGEAMSKVAPEWLVHLGDTEAGQQVGRVLAAVGESLAALASEPPLGRDHSPM